VRPARHGGMNCGVRYLCCGMFPEKHREGKQQGVMVEGSAADRVGAGGGGNGDGEVTHEPELVLGRGSSRGHACPAQPAVVWKLLMAPAHASCRTMVCPVSGGLGDVPCRIIYCMHEPRPQCWAVQWQAGERLWCHDSWSVATTALMTP
jgi:hypothetical protein